MVSSQIQPKISRSHLVTKHAVLPKQQVTMRAPLVHLKKHQFKSVVPVTPMRVKRIGRKEPMPTMLPMVKVSKVVGWTKIARRVAAVTKTTPKLLSYNQVPNYEDRTVLTTKKMVHQPTATKKIISQTTPPTMKMVYQTPATKKIINQTPSPTMKMVYQTPATEKMVVTENPHCDHLGMSAVTMQDENNIDENVSDNPSETTKEMRPTLVTDRASVQVSRPTEMTTETQSNEIFRLKFFPFKILCRS